MRFALYRSLLLYFTWRKVRARFQHTTFSLWKGSMGSKKVVGNPHRIEVCVEIQIQPIRGASRDAFD